LAARGGSRATSIADKALAPRGDDDRPSRVARGGRDDYRADGDP
jgi:hypothetical protein